MVAQSRTTVKRPAWAGWAGEVRWIEVRPNVDLTVANLNGHNVVAALHSVRCSMSARAVSMKSMRS